MNEVTGFNNTKIDLDTTSKYSNKKLLNSELYDAHKGGYEDEFEDEDEFGGTYKIKNTKYGI